MTDVWHIADDLHERVTTGRDFARLFAGKKLGNGITRWVFENKQDPTCVLKFEVGSGDMFQNVIEWKVWEAVRADRSLRRWFAPCVAISENGLVLIQKKVEPVGNRVRLKKVPDFLTDVKDANWGVYKGRLVCHDYGLMPLWYLLDKGKRMRRSHWKPET